jgi:hypothetical protein
MPLLIAMGSSARLGDNRKSLLSPNLRDLGR